MRQVSLPNNVESPHEIVASEPPEILNQLGYEQVLGENSGSEEIATIVTLSNDPRPFAKVEILGISVLGLLDSGAERTVLGVGVGG